MSLTRSSLNYSNKLPGSSDYTMQSTDLPGDLQLDSTYMLDWSPALHVAPNEQLLHSMTKRRSRQSETSRKRQNFISGQSLYTNGSRSERAAKQAYLEEWHARIDERD